MDRNLLSDEALNHKTTNLSQTEKNQKKQENGHQGDLLVVDDVPANLHVLFRMLSESGYKVRPVTTGRQALVAIKARIPDLILLDIKMPEMDGFEVCRRLKENELHRDIPIIFISALDDLDNKMKAFSMGGVDYITKPFQVEEVLIRVSTHLNIRHLQDQLKDANDSLQRRIIDLEESETKFHNFIMESNDGMALIDESGMIVEWNNCMEQITGWKRDEVLSKAYWDVQTRLTVEEKEKLTQTLEANKNIIKSALETGQASFLENMSEHLIKAADGQHQIIQQRAFPMKTEKGYHIGIVTRSITERRKMEDRVMELQKLAALGELATGVAHELNSPLQIITAVSDGLLRRKRNNNLSDDYLQDSLKKINQHSWRIVDIVRSMQIYSQTSPSNFEICNLNNLINDTLLLIEYHMQHWSRIMIITDLADNLPKIECDRNKITQVLVNLLINARDAQSRDGIITIRTGYDYEHENVWIEVEDQGEGIPEDDLNRIFDPFFTTKPSGKGTGMGLAAAYEIVRAHGAKIDVQSKVGEGTTIIVSFPLTAAA